MPDRFLRERECRNLTGLSRSTRWRLERQHSFPRRRRISDRTVGWLASELEDWLVARPPASGLIGNEPPGSQETQSRVTGRAHESTDDGLNTAEAGEQ